MENKILPKKSTESGRKPTSLQLSDGEVAVNYPDQQWYGKNPSTHQVVPIGAPYVHSHDQLFSLNPATGGPGVYDLEITNDGDLTISDGSIITTISPSSSVSRRITLPDKTGTIALLDDITGGGGGAADELLSQDATKKITLSNAGTLNYEAAGVSRVYALPGIAGTIGLRGADTVVDDAQPPDPYIGLRWIDSTIGRAFDWFVDASGGGHWVETGVGSDGRQVDFRVSGGYIQWQYSGDTGWVNLVSLADLRGADGLDGEPVDLRVTATHIEWRVGTGSWNQILSLEQIKGPAGSNATVTTASINTALGYTPDNPTSARTPTTHTHDDRYFTESEVTILLAEKQAAGSYAATSHNHDASHITTGKLSIDRIPILPSQAPVVSSGGLAALTTTQQAEVTSGTVVVTTDGKRYVYKGSGDKAAAGSYIELADLTPSWSAVTEKPTWIATFDPATSTFSAAQVTGLASVAKSGSYSDLINAPAIPAAQVNADWSAMSGVSAILNKPYLFSGDYNDLTNKPATVSAKEARSAWDGLNRYAYYGTAPIGTAENAAGWTIKRIATTVTGAVTSTLTETGLWTNRANLFP